MLSVLHFLFVGKTRRSITLLAVVNLESSKVHVDFPYDFHSSIAASFFLERLVCRHLNQVTAVDLGPWESLRGLSVGRGRHEGGGILLVSVESLESLSVLLINLLIYELVERGIGNILHAPILVALLHEPVEDLFEGVLLALLIRNIVGIGCLLVKLSE